MRAVVKLVGLLVVILVIGAGATFWFVCPCGYIPGGPLSGDPFPKPDSDWSFVNDLEAVPLCQIEVDFLIPRSMNVNCMSYGGDLFVSCSQCAGKQWSARALAYPDGKVLAAGRVYAITYRRVVDDEDLDNVWAARLSKLGRELSPRPAHWWTFNLASR